MIKRFAVVSAIPPLQAWMTFAQAAENRKGSPSKLLGGQAPLAVSAVVADSGVHPIVVGI
jgi:hypothetical protein